MQNQKRVVNLQSRSERMGQKLRYGVMVALQILALSVRVRVLLPLPILGETNGLLKSTIQKIL